MVSLNAISFWLILSGWLLTGMAVALPYWKQSEEFIESLMTQHDGLWLQCTDHAFGNWQCQIYQSWFLKVPTEIQVARVLSTLSLLAGFLSLGASIRGQRCMGDCVHKRAMIVTRKTGSGLAMLSALLIAVCSMWFAHKVWLQYYANKQLQMKPSSSMKRYVWGNCIYLCWAGGGLNLIGGILAGLSASESNSDFDDFNSDDSYREKSAYRMTPAAVSRNF